MECKIAPALQRLQGADISDRFIIAKLLICSLSTSLNAFQVRDRLKDLPTGLRDTYVLTMKRIGEQEPALVDLAIAALSWVYFAKRTLAVNELRHAVSFQLQGKISDDALIGWDTIQSACAGLLTFVESEVEDTLRGYGKGERYICQFARELLVCHPTISSLTCNQTSQQRSSSTRKISGRIIFQSMLGIRWRRHAWNT